MQNFYAKYKKEELTILDVREIHEFNAGHIPSAQNLPLSILGLDFPKLDKNKNTILFVKQEVAQLRHIISYRLKVIL